MTRLWSQNSAFKVILTSLLIATVFLVYLLFMGIPRTQARNLYNQAIVAADFGSITTAQRHFQEALLYWPEPYIQQKLDQLK